MEALKLNLGDYFYYVNCYGRFLYKVKYKSEQYFEWKSGYAKINQLTINKDKKSRVKFILTDL